MTMTTDYESITEFLSSVTGIEDIGELVGCIGSNVVYWLDGVGRKKFEVMTKKMVFHIGICCTTIPPEHDRPSVLGFLEHWINTPKLRGKIWIEVLHPKKQKSLWEKLKDFLYNFLHTGLGC